MPLPSRPLSYRAAGVVLFESERPTADLLRARVARSVSGHPGKSALRDQRAVVQFLSGHDRPRKDQRRLYLSAGARHQLPRVVLLVQVDWGEHLLPPLIYADDQLIVRAVEAQLR